jgi:hypothetical protein
MAKQTSLVSVDGTDIRFYQVENNDYISMTDIAKRFNDRTDQIIANWLRTRSTVEFLGAWEVLHNPNFNPLNFEGIKNQTGSATFVLSVSDWVETTSAIGILAKTGRYGGTYAHRDIAFEFISYLNPTFKLYVIKEFQRLKIAESEQQQQSLEWNIRRILSKVNYRIHTDAIKSRLIPDRVQATQLEGLYYASEADLLNLALFGMTAKTWRENNPEAKGNIRDHATAEQLLVLANLENLNAEFIKMNWEKAACFQKLNDVAIYQMELLVGANALNLLKEGDAPTEIL